MARQSISAQLRDNIQKCGKTRYRLSLETGISQSVLSRFVSGKSELTIANAEKLCVAIGTELLIKTKKGK